MCTQSSSKGQGGGSVFWKGRIARMNPRERQTQGLLSSQRAELVTNHKPGNKEKIDDAKHGREGEGDYNSTHNKRIRMPE